MTVLGGDDKTYFIWVDVPPCSMHRVVLEDDDTIDSAIGWSYAAVLCEEWNKYIDLLKWNEGSLAALMPEI